MDEKVPLHDADRTEWNRIWSARECREIENTDKIDPAKFFNLDLGPPLSALVSKIPDQYIKDLFFPTDICPICGEIAEDPATRYAVSLHPEFERIKALGASVWVHKTCFEVLPVSDKPTPIPW